MRKLIILTYNFAPSSASGAFRMLGFVRHLPSYGWKPIVIAPPGLPWEPDDPELVKKLPSESVIIYVKYVRGSLTQRLAPISIWLPKALNAASLAIRKYRPEAILTSGPPHQIHLLGLALSYLHKLPWVADFRDPWVADGVIRSGLRTGWDLRWQIAARLERAVFERAAVVIANAPKASQAIVKSYPALKSKVTIIANGFDREAFDPPEIPAPVDLRIPLEVVHAGALYHGRDPRPFLEAVATLISSPHALPRPLRVLLLGPKPEDDTLDLNAEIQRRGLQSVVTIGGQVPYARALEAMKRAGILLLFDTPGRKIGLPAKVYEYIGAGRPILALGERDGDLAWALRESGAPHRIVSASDPEEIGIALADLVRSSSSVDTPKSGGRQHLSFTRDALAGRLAEVFEQCTLAASQQGHNIEQKIINH